MLFNSSMDRTYYWWWYYFVTDLTLSKTGNLRANPKDSQTWFFDLYVEEEYIPENAIIIVDIHYLNCYNVMGNYIKNEG